MFIPKRPELQKNKKFKSYSKKYKFQEILNGNFGFISLSFCLISFNQLEALRRYLSRRIFKFKRKSKKMFKIGLNQTFYKKSSKARMGKGKGKFNRWYGYIRPGLLIFEFYYPFISYFKLKKNFKYINTKLPFKCKLISKNLFFKNY